MAALDVPSPHGYSHDRVPAFPPHASYSRLFAITFTIMSPFTSELVLAFATIVVLLWCCASLFLRLLRHKHTKAILAQLAAGKMDSNVPIKDRPGTMIGAWGFQFFESDHDYDIVNHLSADMGLCDFNPSMCLCVWLFLHSY